MSYIKYPFDESPPTSFHSSCNGHPSSTFEENGVSPQFESKNSKIEQPSLLGDFYAKGNRLRKKFGLHWPLAGMLIVGGRKHIFTFKSIEKWHKMGST